MRIRIPNTAKNTSWQEPEKQVNNVRAYLGELERIHELVAILQGKEVAYPGHVVWRVFVPEIIWIKFRIIGASKNFKNLPRSRAYLVAQSPL
jgi:hypothetical protein